MINKTPIKKFDKKWKALTGDEFTINQARKILLDTADKAFDYFYDEDDRAVIFKAKFNNIVDNLPFRTLPRISELIKTEVMAHLELNYGELFIAWLTDN